MRIQALACLSLILALSACRTHKPVQVDTTEAEDLPREVVIQKLSQLLPTAEHVYCTLPKVSVRPTEIKTWNIRNESIEIDYGKGSTLLLQTADILQVKLELIGRTYYTARVWTTVQTEKDKDHFQFQWRSEESAKRAVELLASLRRKSPAPPVVAPPTDKPQ